MRYFLLGSTGRKFFPWDRVDGGTLGIRSKVDSSGPLEPQPVIAKVDIASPKQAVHSSKVFSP